MGKSQAQPQPKYVKARVVAEVFDVSRGTVYEWAKKGIIPCYRDPDTNVVRFDLEEVKQAIRHEGRDEDSCSVVQLRG